VINTFALAPLTSAPNLQVTVEVPLQLPCDVLADT
jgi:hypothetical protein